MPIERDRATSLVVACRSPTTALSFSHYKANLIIDLVMFPPYDSGIFQSARTVENAIRKYRDRSVATITGISRRHGSHRAGLPRPGLLHGSGAAFRFRRPPAG